MAQEGLYTRFIKISRIDKDGIDNSNALNSLSTINIPWSDGSKATYKVIGKTASPDYYSYVVEYNSTSSLYPPDFANLDYNFTGSYPSSFNVPGGGSIVTYIPITKDSPVGDYILPLNDGTPFTNVTAFPSSSVVFDTYPQKNIELKTEGTITNNSSAVNSKDSEAP